MTVFASSLSAAFFNAASALALSAPASSMSNTLPWRTLATPSTPSDFSAPSMALPCGSRMPVFKVTVTRAFTSRSPLALHQHRAGACRTLVLHEDAEAFCDFGIGLEQAAEIPAEAVLVALLVRLDVPQTARVRRNLVGDDDPHHLVLEQPPALHLEVDEADADAEKEAGEEVVDTNGERHDVVDLLRRRPAERSDVLFRHHGVVELVVLVIKFDDRARQLRALLDAEALRQRASGDIPHHHLQRHDLDLANQLLAHVKATNEVGRHPDVIEVLKQVLRDPVVEDTLALDHLMLFRIKRGGVVLEVLDQGTWLRTFVKNLCLAFINATPTAHGDVPCFVEIHIFGVLRFTRTTTHGGAAVNSPEPHGNRTGTTPSGNLSDWLSKHNRSGPSD